jgi:hypothetical protein
VHNALAAIGGIVAIVSVVPYVLDILRHKTRPNIVSWFTWTILTGIATAAAFAAHEPRTAILTLASTLCTGLVVVLGLRFGIAKFSLLDILCQIGAVVGLALWLIFNSPTIGIVVPVTIDFIAVLPTLHHAWLKPYEETWQTFFMATAAPVFTLVSLTTYTTASLLYPAYLLIANISITATILASRRRHVSQAQH